MLFAFFKIHFCSVTFHNFFCFTTHLLKINNLQCLFISHTQKNEMNHLFLLYQARPALSSSALSPHSLHKICLHLQRHHCSGSGSRTEHAPWSCSWWMEQSGEKEKRKGRRKDEENRLSQAVQGSSSSSWEKELHGRSWDWQHRWSVTSEYKGLESLAPIIGRKKSFDEVQKTINSAR